MYVVYDPTRSSASNQPTQQMRTQAGQQAIPPYAQQATRQLNGVSTPQQGEVDSVGKKVLSEVSVAQITASALAAVTAMLFSSQIGFAGSVIGVALSAAVTAFSSQIYKSFLVASKKKAKDQLSNLSSPSSTTAMPAVSQAGAAPETAVAAAAQTQEIYSKDHAAFAVDHDKYSHAVAKESDNAVSGSLTVFRKRWFVIAALTVASMVTVFLTVGVINTATHGQGIGHKPASIVALNSQESTASSTLPESSTESSSKTGSSSKAKVKAATEKKAAAGSSTSKKNKASSSSVSKAASGSSSAQTGSSSSSAAAASSSSSTASSGTEDGDSSSSAQTE